MENSSIGIVLIHGAGLNSSVWNDLRREMHVSALAIDFPNRLAGDKANEQLTFIDYVASAADQIDQWKHSRIILVAHSIGACVGLELIQRYRDEIVGFVAIGSVIPKSGKSFVSSLPVPQRWIMPAILSLMGTKPPPSALVKELCNDLMPSQSERIVKNFTPESKALYTAKINYELQGIPRLYINLMNDNSVPPAYQKQMAANLEAKIVSVNSGHLPMLSRAPELARIIMDFVYGIMKLNEPVGSVKPVL